RKPWPDFLNFYSSASGAGWIVPKKYVEKVGDEAFKQAPIGAGPYKFVSFTPGVELVLEAFEGYWRKPPSVKRLVMKVIPDEATRLAALKRGEVDIAYSIRGELAEELKKTPGLALKPVVIQGTFWLYFPDQWAAKSPWHDQRVRDAARFAIDCTSISEALTLGYSPVTNNIIPDSFDFYWKAPPPVYDLAKAKKLLADAGHRNGFEAGDYYCDSSYANLAEAVINNLQEVGIRVKLRPLERAAFFAAYSEKKLKNIVQGASGAFGNCATRAEAFAVRGGTYVYGSYPDIDTLFAEQAVQMDRARRETTLRRLFAAVAVPAVAGDLPVRARDRRPCEPAGGTRRQPGGHREHAPPVRSRSAALGTVLAFHGESRRGRPRPVVLLSHAGARAL